MGVSLDLQSLPHAVFLHRVANRDGASERTQARLAQGAFLVLRLIDLLTPGREQMDPAVFRYQWAATERFCRDLAAGSTEGAHLHGLATGARDAARRGTVTLITPALFAYAHYLEDCLRLEEGLDVLGSLAKLTPAGSRSADRVALLLRVGRLNRKLNRFDEAEEAYAAAGEAAHAAGNRGAELLSRIGAASTMRLRGNLPEAERRLVGVLQEARAAGVRDAEARAEHDLAVVQQDRGSTDQALVHAWRAFELYEDERSQMRALNDVGWMLLTLGDAVGAQRALSEVQRRSVARDNVTNATIELMHCASFQRDRVGFERHRAQCVDVEATMPPNILADYLLKAGIGEARFGNFQRAALLLDQSLQVATAAGLHALVFSVERIKDGLSACESAVVDEMSELANEHVLESEEVQLVSASVADLAGVPD